MELRRHFWETGSQATNPDNTLGYGIVNLTAVLDRLISASALSIYNFSVKARAGYNFLAWEVRNAQEVEEWVVQRSVGDTE
jgi:hypothetical protein